MKFIDLICISIVLCVIGVVGIDGQAKKKDVSACEIEYRLFE